MYVYGIQRRRGRTGLYLKDDVPFSCCNPTVLRPCFHREMRDRSQDPEYPVDDSTLYSVGCSRVVHLYTSRVGSWVVCGFGTLAGLAVVLVVTCRYLQTSVTEALRAGDVTLPSHGYLLAVGRRHAPGTSAPPPTPASQPSSPRKVAPRRRNANDSNRQMNNSAALSELVEELMNDSASQWSVNASDLALIAEQLAPSSSRQAAVDEPSGDDDATSGLRTATRRASAFASASREIPAVRSSTSVASSGSASSSPPAGARDNFNSNAATAFDSLRSFRPTRSVAPSLIVPDRSTDGRTVSRGRKSSASRRTINHAERSRSRRRSTSRSFVDSQRHRMPRVSAPARRYKRADKTAEARRRDSSGTISDVSSDRSSFCESYSRLHVKPSQRMKTRKVKVHGYSGAEHNVQSKCTSKRRSVSGRLGQTCGKRTEQRSASAAGPNRPRDRAQVGCPLPATVSIDSPEAHSVEGGSSDWSTVSCETVGDGSLTRSKRRTSAAPGVSTGSAAALLALKNYLGTYNDNWRTAADSHESIRRRSNKSSKLVQKSPHDAFCGRRTRQTSGLPHTRKQERSSAASWSTVSYLTLSRPPSSELDGEVIVDEEHASISTGQTLSSKRVRQTNNGCNSDRHPSHFDVFSPEVHRRLSENYQRLVGDCRTSSSVTSPWTVGHPSCGIRSLTNPQKAPKAEVQIGTCFAAGPGSRRRSRAASRCVQSEHRVGLLPVGGHHKSCQRRLELELGSGDADNQTQSSKRRRSADYRVRGTDIQ